MAPVLQSQERMTFREGLQEWLRLRCIGKKPKTQKFYREVARLLSDRWLDHDQPRAAITTDDVLRAAERCAHVCPSRWNALVGALAHIAPHARKLKRRPMRDLDFTPPSQLQFEAMLAALDATPRSQSGLIVRFLALTGLRIGEAQKLTWSDIGPDCVHVRRETAKNGRPRAIPIMDGLPGVLERLRSVGDGVHVLPQRNPRKALEKAAKAAGLGHWTNHACRHYFATRCIQSGVDLPTVARWLGHQDGGALAARLYYHLADDHSQAMARRVRITTAAAAEETIPAESPDLEYGTFQRSW